MQFLQVTKKQTTTDIEALFPKKRSTSGVSKNSLIPENRSRYKVIQTVGHGVSGHVVKAKDHKTGKIVAAKHIKFNLTSFYKFKQIYREVAILRRLRSQPGSARYVQQLIDVEAPDLDTGFTKKELCVVSEFIEGMTLQDYLDKAQRKEITISLGKATTLVFNLLKAVEFIHTVGVLHRDLKPANLMVTPELGIKLVDFGLARTVIFDFKRQEKKIPTSRAAKQQIAEILEAERKTRKLCKRSLSPHVCARSYRPPEVAITEPYSFSADIWSVGCIIAEILRASDACELREDQTRQLFPACSNFPLTPDPFCASSEISIDCLAEDDLSRMIIGILGDPKQEDLSFISRTRRTQIVQSCFTGSSKSKFIDHLYGAPRSLVSLMNKCLQYNPYFRYSASMLLQSEAFASQPSTLVVDDSGSPSSSSSSASYNSDDDQTTRRTELTKIFLEVDAPDAFDYDKRQPRKHCYEDLRSLLSSEVNQIRKQ